MFDLFQTNCVFSLVDEQKDFYFDQPTFRRSISIENDDYFLIVSLCSTNLLLFNWFEKAKSVQSTKSDDQSVKSKKEEDDVSPIRRRHLNSKCPHIVNSFRIELKAHHSHVVDFWFTTAKDLLILTGNGTIFTLPALQIIDRRVRKGDLGEDGRLIVNRFCDDPAAIASFYSEHHAQEVIIIGSVSGTISLVSNETGLVIVSTAINEHICKFNIIDNQQVVVLLITCASNRQWRYILERRLLVPPRGSFDTMEETIGDKYDHSTHHNLFNCLSSGDSSNSESNQRRPVLLTSASLASGLYSQPGPPGPQSDDDDDEASPVRCFLMQQDSLLFNLIINENESVANLSIFESNFFKHKTSTPLARYILPKSCIDLSNPLIVLSERFVLSANQQTLHLISRQHSDFRRISHDNQIVSQITFPSSIVEFFVFPKSKHCLIDFQNKKSNQPQPDDFVLESMLVITYDQILETIAKDTCLAIFLQVLQPSLAIENLQKTNVFAEAEQLLFSLKLPSNLFFEHAALHYLTQRDFVRAFRLFSAAGVRALNRLMHCIRLGFVNEAITCIEQTLMERTTQIDLVERSQLSTLLVECLVERYLDKHLSHEKQLLATRIERWLLYDLWFDALFCVRLFMRVKLFNLAEKVALARQEYVTFLPLLLEYFTKQEATPTLLSSTQFNQILRCSLNGNIVIAFIQNPSIINKYLRVMIDRLPQLSTALLQLASTTFDPRRPVIRLLLELIPELQRQYLKKSSDLEVQALNNRDLLNFYFISTFLLKRNQPDSTVAFDQRLLSLTHSNDTSQIRPIADECSSTQACELQSSSSSAPSTSAGNLGNRNWINAGFKRSYYWNGVQLYTFGLSFILHEQNNLASQAIRPMLSQVPKISVICMSTGAQHTIVITDHGCFALGRSRYGQLGCGPQIKLATTPLLIEAMPIRGMQQISCGQYHTLALHENGTLYSWGWGVHGQLGHGGIENEYWPRPVAYFQNIRIKSITAGSCHSLVLDEDGIVYVFGSGLFGQTGRGRSSKCSTPRRMWKVKEPIEHISARYFQSVAISKSNQTMYVWGCNPQSVQFKAQCIRRERIQRLSDARKASKEANEPSPQKEDFGFKNEHFYNQLCLRRIILKKIDGRVIKCETGALHNLILTSTGKVYSWGRGPDSQMGHDCNKEYEKPTLVTRLSSNKIIDIAAGFDHSLALTEKNEVLAWGNNSNGQLGVRSQSDRFNAKTLEGIMPLIKKSNKLTNKASVNRPLVAAPKEVRIEFTPVVVSFDFRNLLNPNRPLPSTSVPSSSSDSDSDLQANDQAAFDELSSFNESFVDRSLQLVRFSIEDIQIARLIYQYRRTLDLQLLLTSASNCLHYQIAGFIYELLNKPLEAIDMYFKALYQQKQTFTSYSSSLSTSSTTAPPPPPPSSPPSSQLQSQSQSTSSSSSAKPAFASLSSSSSSPSPPSSSSALEKVEQVSSSLYEKCNSLLTHFLIHTNWRSTSLAQIMRQILFEWKSNQFDQGDLERILSHIYTLHRSNRNFMFGIVLIGLFERADLPEFSNDFKMSCVQLTLSYIEKANLSSLMSEPVLELLAPNPTSLTESSSQTGALLSSSTSVATNSANTAITTTVLSSTSPPSSSSASSSPPSCSTAAVSSNEPMFSSSTEQAWKNLLRNIQNGNNSTSSTTGKTMASSATVTSKSPSPAQSSSSETSSLMKSVSTDSNDSEIFMFSCNHEYGRNFFEKIVVRQLEQLSETQRKQANELEEDNLVDIWLQKYHKNDQNPFVTEKCPFCVLAENS